MELSELQKNAVSFVKKYKYVIAVVAVGIVLMLIPTAEKNEKTLKTTQITETSPTVEEELEAILCQIEGAGRVEVFLTITEGSQTIYQTNNYGTGSADSNRTDTVTITDAQRNQTGLIKQVNPPLYRGAIVVCDGADNPTIQYAITDAVAKVIGLGANRISVLKMK